MFARGRRWMPAALAVAVAIAGCGGDEGPPAPPRSAEAEETTLDRLGQEVEQNGCRNPRAVWHSAAGPVDRKTCRRAFRLFEGFAVGDLRPYGPAAVVGFGKSGFTTVGLVLDRDRRYRVVAVTTKLKARPTPATDRLAARVVAAVAEVNCQLLVALATDTGDSTDPCDLKPVVAFGRALEGVEELPTPRRLGSEGGMAFYEVLVEPDRFYVIVLVEDHAGRLSFANVYPAG